MPKDASVEFCFADVKRNRVETNDASFHNWYRFVLSYPPHIVRDYITKFGLTSGAVLLDPFSGTGTTALEAKICGLSGIGIEANDMAHFASTVKIDWDIEPEKVLLAGSNIFDLAKDGIDRRGDDYLTLPEDSAALLITGSISPKPLNDVLILRNAISTLPNGKIKNLLLLALARTAVADASNLRFSPEVSARGSKDETLVVEKWFDYVSAMVGDLRNAPAGAGTARIIRGDSRQPGILGEEGYIDAVFTSPPYPNEKDYTRATRLESVLLGFMTTRDELRAIKKTLLRSNSRGIYTGDTDDGLITDIPSVMKIAKEIEDKRIALCKDSGFEKRYAHVVRHYFGGMAKHLMSIKPHLKDGAMLGYVVGDQASFFQVLIRTGELLADVAKAVGYEVVGIDLFRLRAATGTKQAIREEVVLLRKIRN